MKTRKLMHLFVSVNTNMVCFTQANGTIIWKPCSKTFTNKYLDLALNQKMQKEVLHDRYPLQIRIIHSVLNINLITMISAMTWISVDFSEKQITFQTKFEARTNKVWPRYVTLDVKKQTPSSRIEKCQLLVVNLISQLFSNIGTHTTSHMWGLSRWYRYANSLQVNMHSLLSDI